MAPSLDYNGCLLTYILVLFMMTFRSCVTPVKPWAVCPICHLREQLYLPAAAVPPPPQKSSPLFHVTGPSTKVGRFLSLLLCILPLPNPLLLREIFYLLSEGQSK
jgi:hypothetical protein